MFTTSFLLTISFISSTYQVAKSDSINRHPHLADANVFYEQVSEGPKSSDFSQYKGTCAEFAVNQHIDYCVDSYLHFGTIWNHVKFTCESYFNAFDTPIFLCDSQVVLFHYRYSAIYHCVALEMKTGKILAYVSGAHFVFSKDGKTAFFLYQRGRYQIQTLEDCIEVSKINQLKVLGPKKVLVEMDAYDIPGCGSLTAFGPNDSSIAIRYANKSGDYTQSIPLLKDPKNGTLSLDVKHISPPKQVGPPITFNDDPPYWYKPPTDHP